VHRNPRRELLVADHAGALQHYDRALGLEPNHEQAALGRIIALTNLGRHDEAIETATRLIALEDQSNASAYYWRARNHHALHHLADARRDITAARNLIATSDILELAGIIEYEQADLDPAQADLTEAIRIAGECTARWYLSLVLRQRKQWLPAGHAFENAMTCYRDRGAATASRLTILRARSDIEATYRERTATSLAASIDADTRQQHLSALMAASHLVAGGDATAARPLMDIASEDPALTDRVTRLRSRLSAPPGAR
jgi:tetratricopeptide (TPR) repeat protein